ncbi:transglycosylase SLT domain-containing protein [Luteibacter aegosomaticola]|uniref:transglycosylase SLT domain-containing protein n=1 Tax=Luteibacter aegosomaticola TaxID=2911538 RepID=UPI001FF82419|nr:transglycosylase SLT domain-containing protein [Luteibacter aegosomaticola]UPG88648.1 transglycosylase SLT domain-containing protein [Luteibacter aegosomaticola]
MTPYQRGGYKYITRGGHRYSLQMRLNAHQERIISQIVDAGFSRGAPEVTISIVVATAFQESSFNEGATNPDSSAIGIFQFLVNPWNERHKHLNRHDTSDQIVAMYDEVDWFRARYSAHLASGALEGTMPFVDYAYASHTAGPFNPRDFAVNEETRKKLTAFKDKWYTLSLHVE